MRASIEDHSTQGEFRMTLGHVYDMDLRRNENLIKEVIIQAQGEVRHFVNPFARLLMSL